MITKSPFFVPFSLVAILSSFVLVGCDKQKTTPENNAKVETTAHTEHAKAEHSESELSPATSAKDFQNVLGQIRGHLWVGLELFRAAHLEEATTHMKHPEDELYTALKPAFTTHNIKDFDAELSALAKAVSSKADKTIVETANTAFLKQLDRVEKEANFSTEDKLKGIADLLRTAGEEFGLAVDEKNQLVNLHEYQDSFGFTKAAEHLITTIDSTNNEALTKAKSDIQALIQPLYSSWPALIPTEGLDHSSADKINAVADQIDSITQKL